MSQLIHCMPVRVYYEDTDHGGVVYYANYLKYMERGRTELLRAQGLELDAIERDHGLMFTVTEAHVYYRKPARFNDLLEVETRLMQLGAASLVFHQHVRLAESEADLVRGEIRLACVDRSGRVRRIPPEIRNRLKPAVSLNREPHS